jgi:hypothetical protein
MKMPHPFLLPEPRRIEAITGQWTVPKRPVVAYFNWTLAATACEVRDFLPSSRLVKVADGGSGDVSLILAPHDSAMETRPGMRVGTPFSSVSPRLVGATPSSSLKTRPMRRVLLRHAGEYSLSILPSGVTVAGVDPAAVFHGLQTLRQVLAQYPAEVPAMTIKDWPDLQNRGVYYDVCRGRVPKLERLLELATLLAQYKINHLQLYIEHTFLFRGHPAIGRNASPLTADDIQTLDTHCRKLHIELVPSLACFGHLATVLKDRQYRHLAEDWAVGRYLDPAYDKLPQWQRRRAWSLAPANPEIYEFLDSLFAEFLPLFSSDQFNICCDETWDLGMGQSYDLCRKKGKGRLYLDHLLTLRTLAAKYGKRIMFWGDIIRHHPELIKDIPGDVTVLDWGYASNHPFARIADFRKAGLPFYACPGTSSWVSLFPRLHESAANIKGFAAAAVREKATGLLNTDWGDGGHHNFMEFSWHGYLFGAEQAWSTNADSSTFASRFCRTFLGVNDPRLVSAVCSLGDVAHLSVSGRYQSVWQHIFFARPDDDLFTPGVRRGSKCFRGKIRDNVVVKLDVTLGRRTVASLREIRSALVAASRLPGADPHKILPYWIFAVDTLSHAARKLTVLAHDGRNTPQARLSLAEEMKGLMKRFKRLWFARNRPSEIRVTLDRYDRVMDALVHSLPSFRA